MDAVVFRWNRCKLRLVVQYRAQILTRLASNMLSSRGRTVSVQGIGFEEVSGDLIASKKVVFLVLRLHVQWESV
jgi:hypothetical protein